ncbi:MAG: DUF5615 family PIN-like protein [Cyclobacteriaceae bacterium]
MTIWIDAQLSPAIAAWINDHFPKCKAISVRQLGLRDAQDQEIFTEARKHKVSIMTKDIDFVKLIEQHGTPPKIIWITCGNTYNQRLKSILASTLPEAIDFLNLGEDLVEISDEK